MMGEFVFGVWCLGFDLSGSGGELPGKQQQLR